jgi:hypothetical protein
LDHVCADKLFPGRRLGYAAIKYAAIVIIVLSILAFIAWYVLPRLP